MDGCSPKDGNSLEIAKWRLTFKVLPFRKGILSNQKKLLKIFFGDFNVSKNTDAIFPQCKSPFQSNTSDKLEP